MIGLDRHAYDRVVPSEPKRRSDDAPTPLDLTAEDKDQLRSAQLELLDEFDRICSAQSLEYFALYGTALGAWRHGGFIPWDDDLDLGMLRSDYDRLTEIVGSEVGDGFMFQTVDTDPYYGCLFGKLRKEGTRCVDKISIGSQQHGGIFIDVFPLDARATGRVASREQRIMRYVGFRLLYLKAGYRLPMRNDSLLARIAQVVVRGVVRVLPRRAIIALTMRHARLGPTASPAQYVSLFGAYFYDRDTVTADWIHPLRELPFEDRTIPVFADVEAYLTQIYGDYAQPPSIEQQIGHHEIVELDFGDQA